ncbi:hypothetical protein [Streptomyces sp. NPDC006640]|uniref:hypothetical protein n=1 Tax=unclassified Streptomyces TaxID=2593676 RepID=UPI00367C92CF
MRAVAVRSCCAYNCDPVRSGAVWWAGIAQSSACTVTSALAAEAESTGNVVLGWPGRIGWSQRAQIIGVRPSL